MSLIIVSLTFALLCLLSYWMGRSIRKKIKPSGFINLTKVEPSIQIDLKYYSNDNFIGCPIRGYEQPICYLSKKAALALKKVQLNLNKKGLGLLVWDAYRPQRAVEHFWEWSQDLSDQKQKKSHFPTVSKADFFIHGYIARKSSHTRGSAVDLTLIHLKNNRPLDMGTPFDFMDPASHLDAFEKNLITRLQHENRMLLQLAMKEQGFKEYEKEWWHFNLPPDQEPYPHTYFDFPIR